MNAKLVLVGGLFLLLAGVAAIIMAILGLIDTGSRFAGISDPVIQNIIGWPIGTLLIISMILGGGMSIGGLLLLIAGASKSK